MFGNRKYTLVNIIQEISRNITDNIQEVVEEVLLRYNLFEIEKDLIREWYKNKTLPNNEMHIELLLGNQEGKDEIHFQLDYLTLFTKIFWYIGREKQLSGYFKGEIFQFLTEPPLVYITSSLEPEVHGEYVSDLHTIYLNVLHHPTIQKDFDYLKTLTDKDLIVNYIYNHMKYFVNSSSIPTVYIHELSHAWRKQDEGIHDSVFLEINGKRAEYEFDPAALTIYREITKFGLYPQFLESL